MTDLYIVRHAWAAGRDDPQWPEDDLRPLTEEGKERFSHVAAKLAGRGMRPEIIATSPLVRCVETARLLAAATDSVSHAETEIVELDELRPGSDLGGLLRWTVRQARKHQQIVWVGHAPDVNRLTATMIGDGQGVIRFSKGSVAAIQFDDFPALGLGALRWLVTAKVLGV
jgi:phosphohistidine phosphatase